MLSNTADVTPMFLALLRSVCSLLSRAKAKIRCSRLQLGRGCEVHWTATIFNGGSVTIGDRSVIRTGAILQPTIGWIALGHDCSVGAYNVLDGSGGLVIGNHVRIGPHVCIYSANHEFRDLSGPIWMQGLVRKKVEIKDDVWIGAGALILAGVTVGSGAVIGAGSVVTHDIPPLAIVAGVPAKVLKYRGEVNERPNL